MAKIKITKVEKCDGFDEKTPFAILHLSKAKNALQSASVNGDNLDYLYPVDVTKLSEKDTLGKQFADVVETYKGSEVEDINLYDISAQEIGGDSVQGYKVVDNDDLQPITVFRRASFDDKETVFSRLKAQVLRQVRDGILSEVEAE